MLTVHQLTKSYQNHTVLNEVTFSLHTNERLALIGPNGSGKSTLLRLIVGIEQAERGSTTFTPPDLRVAYVSQDFNLAPTLTLSAILADPWGELRNLESRVAQLAERLATHPADQNTQTEYDAALTQLNLAANRPISNLSALLAAFDLDQVPLDLQLAAFSGGQKTRLALALALCSQPDLLLLDEPTNHLDVSMIAWLEEWLLDFCRQPGKAALFVSHDRAFLDRLAQRVLYLDPAQQTIHSYLGNYANYLQAVQSEFQHQAAQYQDQVTEIQRLRQDILRTKNQSERVELTTTSRQPNVRRIAKKVARKAASREKKLERYISSSERVEKPKAGWQMDMHFTPPAHIGQIALTTTNLSVGYHPNQPLLQGLNLQLHTGERAAFTGPNGSGKTTLLRTIHADLAPLSGTLQIGAGVQLGYLSQEQEQLPTHMTALEIIQSAAPMNETEARNFLHHYLFSGDEPLRPAGLLSFGERSRLALARLVAAGCTFLLLDEPINHLDIPSRERFETALQGFPGAILAVVHDRYFIRRFATQVWQIVGSTIQLTNP